MGSNVGAILRSSLRLGAGYSTEARGGAEWDLVTMVLGGEEGSSVLRVATLGESCLVMLRFIVATLLLLLTHTDLPVCLTLLFLVKFVVQSLY